MRHGRIEADRVTRVERVMFVADGASASPRGHDEFGAGMLVSAELLRRYGDELGEVAAQQIFESIAGDSPVCFPSSTSPIFFFNRIARILGPIA
jgi:hypothetical protein